jgi:hypothetical protein
MVASFEGQVAGAKLPRHITPQFSGRALPVEARRACIMKWSTRGVAATTYHGPLQLLVMRWHNAESCGLGN